MWHMKKKLKNKFQVYNVQVCIYVLWNLFLALKREEKKNVKKIKYEKKTRHTCTLINSRLCEQLKRLMAL